MTYGQTMYVYIIFVMSWFTTQKIDASICASANINIKNRVCIYLYVHVCVYVGKEDEDEDDLFFFEKVVRGK